MTRKKLSGEAKVKRWEGVMLRKAAARPRKGLQILGSEVATAGTYEGFRERASGFYALGSR